MSPQSSLMLSNLMRLSASHNGCFWNSSFTIFKTMRSIHIGSPKSFSGSLEEIQNNYWRVSLQDFSILPPRHKLLCCSFTYYHFTRKFPVLKISFVHVRTYAYTKVRYDPFLIQPPLLKIKNIIYV